MNFPEKKQHWTQISEETFVAGIYFLYAIYRLLGRWPFRLCMYPVVIGYWITRPHLRAASMQYLDRLQTSTGALNHSPTWIDSLKHVALFAETMLDKLLALSGHYRIDSIQLDALHTLRQAIESRKGGIIVTAHIGCLELCRAIAEHHKEIKLNIIVHTRHAEKFTRILQRLSKKDSLRLIEMNEITPATATQLANYIAAGEFIAITGDRVPYFSRQAVNTLFLGHNAPFPIGPYMLAYLLKCPLYMLACLHDESTYKIYCQKLADQVYLPRNNRQLAMNHYLTAYVEHLTHLLQQSPYDWFNFFPFWDQQYVNASQ